MSLLTKSSGLRSRCIVHSDLVAGVNVCWFLINFNVKQLTFKRNKRTVEDVSGGV
ncbi:MAG: hypothetical protein IH876_12210 [Gemmatimonadetes bacterium]|nr:hypothetical protein [Gemmatimonadota bacterium]